MSAIAGIYYLDNRAVKSSELDSMIEKLAHRGRDGSDSWSEGPVGLGHRMLWTTPESLHERLPLQTRSSGLTITADARIDNRTELINLLDLSSTPAAEISDSELILAAYEKWGELCAEKLVGDFAFAIWDSGKQILYCARDHFGVKPFYYHLSRRTFVFASEIKALLCLPDVPRRLNELQVADHLAPVLDDPSITFYQEILRLPPHHTLIVSREKAQLRSYWSLDPSVDLRLGSDQEYAEAFRELFTEAVHCRMRSAFPVGSTLSGGLDSSSVTCTARQLFSQDIQNKLHTFSVIYDNVPKSDERFYQNAVLAQGGLDPHYVHGDQLSPMEHLDSFHWHLDEANFSGNLFMFWGMNQAASNHGVRVLLCGHDGDTVVSHGTGYMIELARAGRWIALFKESRGYANHFKHLSTHQLMWMFVSNWGLYPVIPRSIKKAKRMLKPARRLRRALWSGNHAAEKPSIINPEFAQRIGLNQRRKDWCGGALSEREFHYKRLTWPLLPSIFEWYDKTAAAFPLERRYPFFDKRLAEFCLALPSNQKMRNGWHRMIMRRAMDGILPREVQWRVGKADLSHNFNRGFLKYDRSRLDQVILKDASVIKDYVNINALREAYHRFVSQHASEDEIIAIWRAVTLAVWMQQTSLVP